MNLLEEEIAPLSDDELRGLTGEFRQKLAALQEECASRRLSLDATLEKERKLERADQRWAQPTEGARCANSLQRRTNCCWSCSRNRATVRRSPSARGILARQPNSAKRLTSSCFFGVPSGWLASQRISPR